MEQRIIRHIQAIGQQDRMVAYAYNLALARARADAAEEELATLKAEAEGPQASAKEAPGMS